MGIRDDLLFAVDTCRSILGPPIMDLRPTSIQIITRRWVTGVRGDPYPPTDAILALPNYTKVRHVTQREIASSGGLFEEGDIVLGRITPQYTSPVDGTIHGFTEAQLAPPVTAGQEVIYRLALQSGASGIHGDYSRIQLRRDRTLHFEIVVGRQRTTPGPL